MNDNRDPNSTQQEDRKPCSSSNAIFNPGIGAALGAGVGAGVGVAIGNIAVGVGAGVAIGAVMSIKKK